MAVAAASIPVASAIATGNARRMATRAGLAAPVIGAEPWLSFGEIQPKARTNPDATMKRTVITAKMRRPRCPNHVSPATNTRRLSAIGMRATATLGM